MNRVEATIFAASEPVPREVLARIVGKQLTRPAYADAIRTGADERTIDLSQSEALVLMCVAYFQPIHSRRALRFLRQGDQP
jgi:segregation and condensation protein B